MTTMKKLYKTFAIAMLALTAFAASAQRPGNTPQETLEAYFQILTTRKVENISELMTSGSLSRLKAVMTEAFRNEKTHGGKALQQRFFGRTVTMEEVHDTPARFFLDHLAREILNAAEMQHFFVDDRDIVGSVEESDDMVHFVVRLYLQQDSRRNSDILVYTLINEDGKWKLEFPPTIRQTLAIFEAGVRRSEGASR